MGAGGLAGGNAYAYADKNVSAYGWTYTSTPSPGDIAVWKAYITAYKQALEDISVTEQSISDAADSYVGHPKEIGEDLTAYIKREAFKDGAKYILNKK